MMITNKDRKTLGIYIHIPYCERKCRYCDFLSYTTHSMDARAYYTIKLIEEIIEKSVVYGKDYIVDTIFIGGGTPSLLEVEYIEEIIDAIYSRFSVCQDSEITIEVNPGTVDRDKLNQLRSLGISRLSIGVQSLNDGILKYLGRIHDRAEALKCYEDARSAGFENINIDMMFGIPGQTTEDWRRDFEYIMNIRPEHVSFYSLQVEEGTSVFSDIVNGRVNEPDSIIDREMYHDGVKLLEANGYYHYEISNAALPGLESKHNLKYWSMKDYLGLGLGAHSFIDCKRFSNTEILKDYLSTDRYEGFDIIEHESSRADNMAEYIFLGLRKIEGISLNDFEKRYGKAFLDLYGHETDNLIERGLIEIINGRLRLTMLGLDLSNQVFQEYV